MIGLNKELERLEKEGKRIKVGLVGTGQMGTDIISQITLMKGIEVVAMADKTVDKVEEACKIANLDLSRLIKVNDPEKGDEFLREGKILITDDYRIIPHLFGIDAVIEATGDPNAGTEVSILSIKNGKHIITLSVEMDITVGVILHRVAERKGVVYTLAAGDEPPAIKELYDFASSLGLRIIAVGKGKNNPLDRFATPDSLSEVARKRGVNPVRLTEFVDGSKTMVEMAAVSNATGLVPDVQGMHGPHASVRDLLKIFSLKKDGGILNKEGIVDYVIGDLKPGVFLIFTTDHPRLKEALILRDMGHGPNYLLVRPYHLCSMEVPLSVALACIEKKPTMYSVNQVSEVVAVAKKDLYAGERLDFIGGKTFFATIDVRENVKGALPIGLAQNAFIKNSIKKGEIIKLSDVQVEENLVFKVWEIQNSFLEGIMSEEEAIQKVVELV